MGTPQKDKNHPLSIHTAVQNRDNFMLNVSENT